MRLRLGLYNAIGVAGGQIIERSYMKNKFWLSIAMAAIGASLLVASAFAGGAGNAASASKAQSDAKGGTLRIDSSSDFDYIDPALAYFSHSWQVMDIVGLRLLGYPDAEGAAGTRLIPTGAAGLPRVSADGKTYVFTVRPGFKFSNGAAVTAVNYSAAIARDLDPKMQSPASSFLDDVKSYKASGMTLTIVLKTIAPDFLARMTMPFFTAIPANLAHIPEGVQAPMVSAGPYYVKEWTQKRSALIARNPFWKANAAPFNILKRPANVDAITYTFGNTTAATKLRIDKGEVDLGGIPAAASAELVEKYGLNKGRFFLRKNLVFWYFNLNNEGTLFKGNTKLRQAFNWAIDRPQIVRQHGYLGGGRTDQILPPGMPGFRDAEVYPLYGVNASSLKKAKSLAAGNTRSGKAILYEFNTSPGPQIAQIVQFNLKQIGIDVDVKLLDRVVQTELGGTRGHNFDILHNGWGADYPDPSNFLNVLLDGARIQATNNVNLSYFNDPVWNKRMQDAAKLSGDARLTTYGKLDGDMMRAAAPMAPYIVTNARIYVSDSVGCYMFSPVHATTNLAGVCKK